MDLLDVLRTRRSVRKFTDEVVGETDVDAILEAGRWAPGRGYFTSC